MYKKILTQNQKTTLACDLIYITTRVDKVARLARVARVARVVRVAREPVPAGWTVVLEGGTRYRKMVKQLCLTIQT